MAHRQHGLLRAVARGGVQDFVQQRNQRGVAFQRVALGADVARVDRLLEDVGANQLVENARAIDRFLTLRFHALLDPLAPLGIGNVHELDADAAAVDAARGISFVAGDVQFGMAERREVAERIEVGLQVSPAAERVEHAFLLLAVNIHHYG